MAVTVTWVIVADRNLHERFELPWLFRLVGERVQAAVLLEKRLTVPVKPLRLVMAIVDVPVVAALMAKEIGFEVMLKSRIVNVIVML